MRPVVGITLGDGGRPGFHAMREDYVRSVEQAGAVPVVLPPVRAEDAAVLLDRLDGVLLSGGVDVDPVLFGQAAGGTLIQDIPSIVTGAVEHDAGGPRWRRVHRVDVSPASRLREILGQDTMLVNSFHHQAVDRLGEGLVVSARSEDGIVEGLEAPASRFVLSVQWHPESFWSRPDSFQPLFDAHAEACREEALACPRDPARAHAGARP